MHDYLEVFHRVLACLHVCMYVNGGRSFVFRVSETATPLTCKLRMIVILLKAVSPPV